jgi:hypothetical protein
MKLRQFTLLVAFALLAYLSPPLLATSNYTYKPGEYVVVADGRSPDGHTPSQPTAMAIQATTIFIFT